MYFPLFLQIGKHTAQILQMPLALEFPTRDEVSLVHSVYFNSSENAKVT